jgi:hypothetical protein
MRPLSRRVSRTVAWLALVVIVPHASAADAPRAAPTPTPVDVAKRVEGRAALPSVHGERAEIGAALVAEGVAPETVERLWRAVDTTPLPGVGSEVDGFLFLTRDPEWLALRDHFAEFLDLPDVTRLTPELVAAFAEFDGVVRLSAITALDEASARALAAFGAGTWGAAIELPAVRDLDADSAAALAKCEALVVLPGLRTLSVEAARALANHEGIGLVIGGLDRLPADVAVALAECRSMQGMMFPDLTALESEPLARRLARQDRVFLPRVTALPPEMARALRGSDGGSLHLPALHVLTKETAAEFPGSGYYGITLGCMASLDADAAAALAPQTGPLVFTGTAPFSAAAAAALAKHPGDIHLPHLEALPADVAAALAPHGHTLELEGLTRLDVATARRLAEHVGWFSLPKLATLDAAAARALAASSGWLELPAITDLPEDVAAALATHRADDDGMIDLSGVTSLTPAAAAALAAADAPVSLAGLTQLSLPVAEALARHRRFLMLDGITELPDDVARALAAHRGGLAFTALSTASDAAIAALAGSEGELALSGFTDISTTAAAAMLARDQPVFLQSLDGLNGIRSIEVARLLVATRVDVMLPNVTAIEGPDAVAIAAALATTKGELALPNLKRISPRALTALLKKQRAQIPEIESIELVPEPGGGNDDFVDPRR